MISRTSRQTALLASAVAMLGVCTAAGAQAQLTDAQVQAFPERPVQVIVPYPPGQATDVIGRIVAEGLVKDWKSGVVVENRPGGASIPGMLAAKNAAPDGYTLTLTAVGPVAINPALYPKLPYDSLKDYTFVNGVFAVPLVIVVAEGSSIRTLRDLVDQARRSPGKIDLGIPGTGTVQHVAAELLKQRSSAELTNVYYKGSGAMLTDIMGGHVLAGVDSVTSALPHLRAGKMRAIAVTAAQRVPQLPDVPTVAEQGFPGFQAIGWAGLLGPRGLPAPIAQKISARVQAVLADPSVQARIRDNGGIVDARGTTEFAAFVRNEVEVWRRVVTQGGIKLE